MLSSAIEKGKSQVLSHCAVVMTTHTIQSAFSIEDPQKRKQEITPLLKSGDFFKKIVVTSGNAKPHVDEQGITYMGIIPFLLNKDSLDL
ncbi:hypothetical protein [Pseudoflavonifractor phocaeensis]|uniref:hypothetical protein n=1 Tax=Pseudoflavonifractor phocaeensis TaxID=1870988 RepID=UPI00195B95FA|nr:hypothetical protein [Pseudoflavonifractor phocaeensis]MBM6926955.1 hypothetical protein [Pseudoflavonifractor phocaeensis]